MKAIVTGGAGFIGSHIAERLVKDGHEVIVIDNLIAGYAKNVPKGCLFVKTDICDLYNSGGIPWKHWDYIHDDVDVIFHNAASKKNVSEKDPLRDLEVNGGGTFMMLKWAVEHGVKRFIHASTGSVYGEVKGRITEDTPTNPVSNYGVSKLAGEGYVWLFSDKIKTTVLRYFHVYGERQENDPNLGGVVSIMKKQIADDKIVTIHGSGYQERVFTHVDDVVEANMKAWKQRTASGNVYNCASKKVITILELVNKLGARKINHDEPLSGDIFKFDVDSSKIERIGVKFRDYE